MNRQGTFKVFNALQTAKGPAGGKRNQGLKANTPLGALVRHRFSGLISSLQKIIP